jgi:hypothetical protein
VNLSDLTFTVASETGETPILAVKGIAATFYFNDSTTGAQPAAPKTAGGE